MSIISFLTSPQAKDDTFTGLTEDSMGVSYFNVMANDSGGRAKTLYSLDNGTSIFNYQCGPLNLNALDLLWRDTARTAASSNDYSLNGAKIWITNSGTVGYDISDSNAAAFRATLQTLNVGQSLSDSFTYAIKMGNGTLSWATANVVFAGVNDKPVANEDAKSGFEGSQGVASSPIEGNVLENDTDVDNNVRANTSNLVNNAHTDVTVKSVSLMVDGVEVEQTSKTLSGQTTIEGQYGTLTIYANGSYSYAINDANPIVDALNMGQHVDDVFKYVINDNTPLGNALTASSTLTITIDGVTENNAPVISNIDSFFSNGISFNLSDSDDSGYEVQLINTADSSIIGGEGGGSSSPSVNNKLVNFQTGIEAQTNSAKYALLQARDPHGNTTDIIHVYLGTNENDSYTAPVNSPTAFFGFYGVNSFVGSDGNDFFVAFPSQDDTSALLNSFDGGKGNDTFSLFNYSAGNTVITELMNGGNDTIKYYDSSRSSNTYTMPDNVENLINLSTTPELTIYGNAENNTIIGGRNQDIIIGAGGADMLTGGIGNDTFKYLLFSDSTVDQKDVITDFVDGQDKIDWSVFFNELSLGVAYFIEINNNGTNTQVQLKSVNVNVAQDDSGPNHDGHQPPPPPPPPVPSIVMQIELLGVHDLTYNTADGIIS